MKKLKYTGPCDAFIPVLLQRVAMGSTVEVEDDGIADALLKGSIFFEEVKGKKVKDNE